MIRALTAALMVLLFVNPGWSQTGSPLLLDPSRVQFKPGEVALKDKTKVPAGTVRIVDGPSGKAYEFSFVESTTPQFFTARVNPTENWDTYAGFSFWVQGDGSKSWGGLEFIDGQDYSLRYGYCFPIDSTDWVKITVAWDDLIPELAAPLVDPNEGYAPSKFRNVWVGKWFYWREFPTCHFAIDRMTLEQTIARDTTDYTPAAAGLPRTLSTLQAGKAITIVTMGDSLSDKRHWANREQLWSELLIQQLQHRYGSQVTLVNPAIGGTTLSQNMILMPRWLSEAANPDLVIIWFGGNDWDSGVRGARFREYLDAVVQRIRRVTKGQTEVLILTTCPSLEKWDTMNQLCSAARDVATERKTGLADIAALFHEAGSPEAALQRQYWAWDKVHLGPAGHTLVAQAVLAAITSGD